MRQFLRGVGFLLRGFTWWRRRPGAMLLGLVPAAIVGLFFVAALTALGFALPGLTSGATPFADGWVPFWRDFLRFGVGAALFGGALFVAIVSFTALTLVVGDPFYERISRTVERDLGGPVPDVDYPFWRSVVDGLSLIGRGILVALLAALLGFIPVVGGFVGAATGVVLTGWLLADELTSRALTARGLTRAQRRALVRGRRTRALGFGVATQLFFLIPLGAIVVMPAAVAGSTELARSLLAEVDASP
ncbi:EI24 domain-containing protein [Microbacterium sp. B2969]|uniref:EI24 domain-containing protein n=1 Tax=Microbacterium alkaliflavum TaxID=3248839 RepID=A0ABW7Q4L8_9MICO